MAGDSGWGDPRIRLLRTAAFVILAGLLVFAVVNDAIATAGLVLGALMVLLGFEGVLRWPPGGGGASS